MSDKPSAEVVVHEWAWKTPAMSRMTVAILQLALKGKEFSANDLAKDLDHGGQGIAGSVFKWLKKDGVIERVVLPGGSPKFVYNEGKNPVGVYRLKSRALALAMLAVHGITPKPEVVQQTEMALS